MGVEDLLQKHSLLESDIAIVGGRVKAINGQAQIFVDADFPEVEGLTSDHLVEIHFFLNLFSTQFLCQAICVPREPQKDPTNCRLNEHGIYIRHCQELNSQPVPSQVGADPTRPR